MAKIDLKNFNLDRYKSKISLACEHPFIISFFYEKDKPESHGMAFTSQFDCWIDNNCIGRVDFFLNHSSYRWFLFFEKEEDKTLYDLVWL